MRKQKDISDAELIYQYKKGNVKSFALLVERWHQTFCKFALWYTKDADVAKDIAQECWTLILKKIHTLQEPEKFKSWAISLVNRRSIDWLKAKRREQSKLLDFHQTNQQDSAKEDDSLRQQKKLLLLQGIQQLSTEQQYIIRLFYVQNCSLKEIANMLRISEGTVKSRLFHAREKLKTILKNTTR